MMKILAFVLAMLLPTAVPADTYLLMAEEKGCSWCARWNAEIAPIYPKTLEGQAAPLRRYDLHATTPDAQLQRGVRFTPTFILIEDGLEVGRIEGYPGEDFFWGLLGMMLDRADIDWKQAGQGKQFRDNQS